MFDLSLFMSVFRILSSIKKKPVKLFIALTVLYSLLSFQVLAKPIKVERLLTAEDLNLLLKAKKNPVVIIDLREPQKYKTSHIPSSINIPISQFHRAIDGIENYVITPLSFQRLASKHGIKRQDHLIFYTDEEIFKSTRAFWIFDFYGHKHISVLNGGFQKWKQKKFTIENQINILPHSTYKVSPKSERLATKLNTKMAVLLNNKQIIDVRTEQEFLGKKSRGKRFGHIPDANNLPWTKLVTQADTPTTLAPPSQLNNTIEKFFNKKSSAILYCNSGAESSLLYFALKLMGFNSSIYDGSWIEWSADKTLAIVNPTPLAYEKVLQ